MCDKYDAIGKAISTEHAAGGIDKYSLNYAAADGSTAITDHPLGSLRTTYFTTVLGVVKSTGSNQPAGSGCAASSNAVTYDANGNRPSPGQNGSNYPYTTDPANNRLLGIAGPTPPKPTAMTPPATSPATA